MFGKPFPCFVHQFEFRNDFRLKSIGLFICWDMALWSCLNISIHTILCLCKSVAVLPGSGPVLDQCQLVRPGIMGQIRGIGSIPTGADGQWASIEAMPVVWWMLAGDGERGVRRIPAGLDLLQWHSVDRHQLQREFWLDLDVGLGCQTPTINAVLRHDLCLWARWRRRSKW